MARAGAKGDTATQIDEALGAEGVDAQGQVMTAVDEGIASAIKSSASGLLAEGDPVGVRAANSLWPQDELPLKQDFVNALRRQFGAELHQVDYRGAPVEAADQINR